MPGTLYLVATPIGNLEDITIRALRILREEVAQIACEDTRQTLKLLNHFGIVKSLVSYHEHNESTRTAELMTVLQRGESVALVSDAGTPLVSDPGYRLVRAAIDEDCPVIAIPGASAVLVALAAAGLPTDRFRFAGFVPPKENARRRFLEDLVGEEGTTVVFESPHRILQTLKEIGTVLGSRLVVLARELTKLHEEFIRGTASSVHNELASRESIKGEITLVIGRGEPAALPGDPVAEVQQLEQDLGLDRMSAIKLVAKRRGIGKSEVYELVSKRLGRKVAGEGFS